MIGRAGLRKAARRARGWLDSFWFIPSACILAAIAAAAALVEVDRRFSLGGWLPGLLELGVSGSRAMLSGIGGTVFGVAGTAFSITISVVATASTSYGPRLVRNFMADRGNQVVLGVLSATFVYSLLVLRTVKAGGQEAGGDFVPHIAVYVAILLAVADVFLLVYFINHIATSIRVETLSRSTRDRFVDAVTRVFRERDPGHPAEPAAEPVQAPAEGVHVLRARAEGYVTNVDGSLLRDAAAARDAVLALDVGVGDPVARGERVARVWSETGAGLGEEDLAALDRALRRATDVAASRDPHRDVAYAEQQVVELAVRALSPGSNDPYTAIGAIDELVPGILLAVTRQAPPRLLADEAGVTRAVIPRVGAAEVIDLPFTHIVPYALGQPLVLEALVGMAARVLPRIGEERLAARLRGHVATMVDLVERADVPGADAERLREAAARLP